MGRSKLKIGLLLLGWLWIQPALAQHPLEADLPDHNHSCLLCALHLDGKLALTPTPPVPQPLFVAGHLAPITFPTPQHRTTGHYRIRAPPPLIAFPSEHSSY
ncbi:hypothetical protein [Aeromonas salmonicida]|uniref:hypothetical protein n=1 Tax=Aeromonas salmonicida TaxID=645 RepID=UPI003CEE4F30